MMASSVFWFSVALILYHHVGYPVLLHLLARSRQRRADSLAPPAGVCQHLPSVTIIVPCHNEAAVIAAKVQNLAALDYPASQLSVVFALDGCTDATRSVLDAALAAVPDHANWKVVEYRVNVGKVAVLNDLIGCAASSIVALTDASALLSRDALIRAARHFSQPEIGVVCGTYVVRDTSNAGERTYWAYQRRLKAQEALVAAPMGAHGALYFFRRDLWAELPADTINDDFLLPMSIVLKGYRAVYDSDIVATDLERSQPAHEFSRRVRIGAGNLQQLLRLWGLGNPKRGWLAFVFLSGKGLRACMPFIVLAAFLSNLVLAMNGLAAYRALLAAGLTVAVLAIAGLSLPKVIVPRLLTIVAYALTGYAAAALGSILLLAGQGRRVWSFSSRAKRASGDAALDQP